MKKARLKQAKQENKITQDTMSAKAVAITFLSLIIIFVAFYLLTDFLIDNQDSQDSNSSTENTTEEVTNISFSQLLKQEDSEYYVFAIVEGEKASFYERYANDIGTTYYEIDMSDSMNLSHLGEETLISNTVKEITISDTTLFLISDGKIEEYYVGQDSIVEYLQQKLPKS